MSHVGRWFFKAPLWLYRWDLGWLMSHRMLLLEHTGRKSGVARQTVLEVVEVIDGSPVVCSGFGKGSDWYLNVRAEPEVSVIWSTQHFPAQARILDRNEAIEVFERYRTDHRLAAKALGRVLGFSLVGDLESAVDSLPLLTLDREGH